MRHGLSSLALPPVASGRRVIGGCSPGAATPIHRENSLSWTRRFALPSSSPRWRSRRTTRSASRSSRSCGRACSPRGCARRRASSRTCARPPTGSRCCATSAAPVTPTRSPRCSATRSRSAPRRSCTTPPIPPRSWATSWLRDRRALRRRSATRSSGCSRRRPTSGRCTTSRPGARWRDMLVARLDFAPGVRDALAFTFERWNGNGFPTHAERRRHPAADARRAPQPRHGGDRPPLLAGARHRRRARPPRPHVRPGARRPLRRARTGLVRPPSRDSSRGTPCSPSSPNPAGSWTARRSTARSSSRPTSSTSSRPTWAATAAAARSSPPTRPRCSGQPEDAVTALRRAALVHDFGTTGGPELDLGQARRADTDGVRPRRAPPDADRADAAPFAGARRAQPGRVGAPREVRRVRIPQAHARGHRRSRRRACWPPPRSTWA